MGIDMSFGMAYAKAEASSNNPIPKSGTIVLSLKDKDKPHAVPVVRKLIDAGSNATATRGTAKHLSDNGLKVEVVNKVQEGRPHIVDAIKNRAVSFVVNTVSGTKAKRDSVSIRQARYSRSAEDHHHGGGACDGRGGDDAQRR